jgi:hypothetical protein
MLRKTILAVAAIATVSAAALVPTTASAHYRWGGWGLRTGIFLGAPLAYTYNYNCVRWVPTVYGYYVKRNVCVY